MATTWVKVYAYIFTDRINVDKTKTSLLLCGKGVFAGDET